MSRTWTILDIAEHEYGKPPSIWLSVFAVVVIHVAGLIITVLGWEQGKPVISEAFFVRAVLMPFLFSGLVCAVIYTGYEEWIQRVDWWNFLCRSERAAWRKWAQAHVAIIDSVALTPEPELAERLLGLEGSMPMNPGKILALPGMESSAGDSRLAAILERLISPFSATVSRFAASHCLEVLLQSADEQDVTELRAAWRKLNLSKFAEFKWEPIDAEQKNLESWFSDSWNGGFRLVVACDLHTEGKAPASSEVAVAMLLASQRTLDGFHRKLRPQARLFRPIAMPSDSLLDALDTLLTAEQTPRGRIRHLWLSNLPPPGRHATLGAIKEAGLTLPVHDVDQAIGKPGRANTLLLQALAAKMVAHGQGAQLVASPGAQQVTLNVVGTHCAPVPHVEAGYLRVLSLSVSGGGACALILIMLGLGAANASAGWFWACLAGFIFLFAIQLVASKGRRLLVEDDFFQKVSRLEART